MFRKDGMSMKKSPLFLLALFIFGTSSLLLGIPMEGDHLLCCEKSNPLIRERARHEYAPSGQDERNEDKNGVIEFSASPRGAFPHIAETANNTKSGSADGHSAIYKSNTNKKQLAVSKVKCNTLL